MMHEVLGFVWFRSLGFVALAVIGLAIEELFRAARPAKGTYFRGVRLNIGIALLLFLAEATIGVAGRVFLVAAVAQLPGAGLLRLPVSATPSLPELLALACVWLIARDFFYYWLHRAQHRFAWLWAIHEVHHSDEHMNVTTTFRHHWLQVPLDTVLILVPFTYLVTPPPAIAAIAFGLDLVIGQFIHLNARIRLPWFHWLIATPHHHRIHHSNEPRHMDRNFAAITPFWDVLFGTYYRAGKDEYPATGLIAGGSPRTVIDAAMLPFRRWRGEPVAVVDGEPAVD